MKHRLYSKITDDDVIPALVIENENALEYNDHTKLRS
jgi:hypothetical protein